MGVRSLLVEPGMLCTDFMDGTSANFGGTEIADYVDAIAQYRAFVEGADGSQPGDPKLLAARIVAPVSKSETPSQLAFGEDTRQWDGAKIEQLRQDIAMSADQG